jgi:RNA polymerase sigma-70 factor (ECF subfamily)
MPPAVTADALEAARVGAGWAFEGIYGALAGHVRRFAAAQGAPDPDATTQEVFLRVFRGLHRFDGDAEHLRSWVFSVARNLLIDERRAAARRPVAAEASLPERGEPGSEDDLVAGLDARHVRAVLDSLPEDQREVVVLRFLADLPLADVAAVTGRSLTAVKALQHRGLARLRRLLQDSSPKAASSPVGATFTSA